MNALRFGGAASWLAATAMLLCVDRASAQDFELAQGSGWSIRFGPAVRFGVNAEISTPPRRVPGPGLYDNGYVVPDVSGVGSGRTWNWGYLSSQQLGSDQVFLNRLDNLPIAAPSRQEISMDALFGGEIVGAYRFIEFELGGRRAEVGLELGYNIAPFSKDFGISSSGTASLTTDAYGLNGGVPPVAPYSGNFQGPGPLINLQPSLHAVELSPATDSLQGSLEGTLHNMRLGPYLLVDLNPRFNVGFGLGYSSVYADMDIDATETLTLSNPNFPPMSSPHFKMGKAEWQPGVYTELRLGYQFTRAIGLYLGGDFQYNTDLSFEGHGQQVRLALGATYGAKAGFNIKF